MKIKFPICFYNCKCPPVTGGPERLFPSKDQKDGDIGGDGWEKDDGEDDDEDTEQQNTLWFFFIVLNKLFPDIFKITNIVITVFCTQPSDPQ